MLKKHFLSFMFAAALFPASALAQHFSVGVVAGAGVTDGFQDQTFRGVDTTTHFSSDSKDFIIGPMVDVSFPFNFSVEFDALYRPLHLATSTTVIPFAPTNTSGTVGTWEFPLLLKYRFSTFLPVVKPLIEVGASFRGGSGTDVGPSHHGITVGAGIEAKILRVKAAPQLRYTRWGSDNAPLVFATPHTQTNQVEFLVGLSF